MTISDEVLRARAYLMHATQQPAPIVADFVRTHGPVEAAAAIENGSAPSAVLAEVVRRDPLIDGPPPAADDVRLIVPESDEWPTTAFSVLRDDGSEPFGLWVRGSASLESLARRAVALVGTRAATAYGDYMAGDFACWCAFDGVTVVTSGSFGVATAAHRAALAAAGPTIAVLAHGVDVTYAPGNAQLFEQTIEHGGLFISEYPPHTQPARHRFREGRRIVAALAGTTVVIEAGPKSGALGVARLAGSYGRRVFAVPGPFTSFQSTGTNQLLRANDAVAVTSIFDVLGDEETERK